MFTEDTAAACFREAGPSDLRQVWPHRRSEALVRPTGGWTGGYEALAWWPRLSPPHTEQRDDLTGCWRRRNTLERFAGLAFRGPWYRALGWEQPGPPQRKAWLELTWGVGVLPLRACGPELLTPAPATPGPPLALPSAPGRHPTIVFDLMGLLQNPQHTESSAPFCRKGNGSHEIIQPVI